MMKNESVAVAVVESITLLILGLYFLKIIQEPINED